MDIQFDEIFEEIEEKEVLDDKEVAEKHQH